MEPLRWILLAAGIAFVLVIYALGRRRSQRNHSAIDELVDDQEDDLPEFSAQHLNNVDEGVGKVRIITGAEVDTDEQELVSVKASTENVSIDKNAITEPAENKIPSEFIVIYILPKSGPQKSNSSGHQFLLGSHINSSVQAMGLTFGEMNIYHYKSAGRNVFSLANMLEPGTFDADSIHDLKTSGLTVFMKIRGDDPLDDLTEMLQRSYQLAGLLGARLCNHKHQILTEQDAEDYRTQVRDFISTSASPELTSET